MKMVVTKSVTARRFGNEYVGRERRVDAGDGALGTSVRRQNARWMYRSTKPPWPEALTSGQVAAAAVGKRKRGLQKCACSSPLHAMVGRVLEPHAAPFHFSLRFIF